MLPARPRPAIISSMFELYRSSVLGQFEAALWMLRDCIEKCPPELWSGPASIIGKYEFWHVAYHTLYCTDYYLSPTEASCVLQPQFYPGGPSDAADEYPSRMMRKDELLAFVEYCLNKLRDVLRSETEQSLKGPSGFPHKRIPRADLYLYNMRHVMHHTGQLSAYLRRAGLPEDRQPRWKSVGWE